VSASRSDHLVADISAFFAASVVVGLMRPPFGEGVGMAMFVAVGGATWVAVRAVQQHHH
jgi:hypothetical protein